MTSTPLLSATALVAGYEPDLPIVNGASLAVAPGEILAVLGPNGAGKSTFIKAIAGLVPISQGRVILDGQDITALPAHRKLAAGLAFVPQTENIFGTMTVLDNLKLAGDRLPDRREIGDRIAALFEAFPDLARQKTLLAGRLSGGQRQMLAVARALMVKPRVLMLDEPTASLDAANRAVVVDLVAEKKRAGVAMVAIVHDDEVRHLIADRLVDVASFAAAA